MFSSLTMLGRLGADPELRYMQDETPVCTMSVAVTHKRGQEEETTWVRAVAFGSLAKVCAEYMAKGELHFFEGRLRVRDYESNGEKRRSVECLLHTMKLLPNGSRGGSSSGSGSSHGSGNAGSGGSQYGPPPADDFDDDIPF